MQSRSPSIATASTSTSSSASSTPAAPPVLLLPALSPQLAWLEAWTKVGSGSLVGYQLWAVEQRITDRDAVLPVIAVFTGEKADKISVDRYILTGSSVAPGAVLSRDQAHLWLETQMLLKGASARISETSEGFLPLTALPSLSPTLSVVQIPGGDYGSYQQQLYLNINLRRLGLGGRRGLRLADASPAQQLHFRQAFRLPIPAPSLSSPPIPSSSTAATSTFTDTVLDLVKLVQHALSLFGLGVVRVVMKGEAERDEYEGGADAMEGESSWRTLEGDGLLCDTTLAALSLFRVDIGEPLLRLAHDESTLSPTLLAGLLSLVIGARGKLIALGCSAVPKDPFERRSKFLHACQSFQLAQHLTPFSPYLTRPFLSTLSTLYARSRHADSSRSKASRALRTRIDASLQLVDPLHSNLPLTLHKARGEEVETDDLDGLSREFDIGAGGGTVRRLWGAQLARKERRKAEKDGNFTEEQPTASEGEGRSFGRGVLKEVRERAGRAGRKLGDNLGLTTAIDEGAQSPSASTLAPSLVISHDSTEEPFESRRSSFDAPSVSKSTSFSTRLSAALSSDRDTSRDARLLSPSSQEISPSSSPAGSTSSLGKGRPPPSRRNSARRAASEAQGIRQAEKAGGESLGAVSSAVPGMPHRRRRHSINLVQDAPEPFQILSRKRLEMDVNLRMTAWTLRQRELKLTEMVDALRVVHTSYGQAVQSLEGPLRARTEQLETLSHAANSLFFQTESYGASGSSISKLETGSKRLEYAQAVLEDKLADVKEFEAVALAKVGVEGSLDVGTRLLGKERSGMRRLVASLDMWRRWLQFLTIRSRWHLRWKRGQKEKVEGQ